jgi:hypothetical protein
MLALGLLNVAILFGFAQQDHRCLIKCPSDHEEKGCLRILSFSLLIAILLVITYFTNQVGLRSFAL